MLRSALTTDRAPLLVFDGELASGQSLIVVPTIWEWDGPDDLLTLVGRVFNAVLDFGARAVMPAPVRDGLLGQILCSERGIGSGASVGRGVFGDHATGLSACSWEVTAARSRRNAYC